MKRRIDEHKGGALAGHADPAARIAGHNVKLGEGGIREIEFLVQTLQLVWGGRDPGLRDRTTLGALRLLTRAGHVPRRSARELEAAYRFLRQVEHRLQMVNDRQTHSLPEKPDDLARIAMFLGFPDTASFARALIRQLARVRMHYAAVFEVLPSPLYDTAAGPALDFRGDEPSPPDTVAALRAMGFATARANRRSHPSLDRRVMCALCDRAARGVDGSDAADDPGSDRQPAASGRDVHPVRPVPERTARRRAACCRCSSAIPCCWIAIAAVLGAAPALADHMAANASALEGLLSPREEDAPTALRRRLRDARGLEDAIQVTSRAVKEEDFSISVATMEGRLDADAAGLQRTAMADAALRALLPMVQADFIARFGRVRGGGMAVVALGKAGGREMMAGSDLDLMFIYDHPREVTESQGARTMAVSQWFVRLAHAYVAALTGARRRRPALRGRHAAAAVRQ